MGTRRSRIAWILPAMLVLSGCAVLGPSSIRNGRAMYNKAMVATNNEQILDLIVRTRYEESAGLLHVQSITANVRVQGSVRAEFGVGPDSNFTGNLVPLTAATLYEENPTISYVPIQGEKYLRQLLAPLPLDLVVLLLNALGGSPNTIELLLKEINGIRNPVFLSSPEEKADGRFREIADLLALLHRRGSLVWSEQPGEKPAFVLFLRGSGPDYAKGVTRLHELLGLEKPRNLDEALTLRVLHAVGTPEGSVLQIVSRSVYDLFLVAAAAVDVPAGHVESGLAPKLPPCGPVVTHFRVRRSQGPPSNSMVAVKHHGWWFSIAATDGHSKATFRLIEAVMTARIADTVDPGAARPMLTVPVSR